MHNQTKIFDHRQKFLFLILKVLFLIKQVKHHCGIFYHTKCKYFRATLKQIKQKTTQKTS